MAARDVRIVPPFLVEHQGWGNQVTDAAGNNIATLYHEPQPRPDYPPLPTREQAKWLARLLLRVGETVPGSGNGATISHRTRGRMLDRHDSEGDRMRGGWAVRVEHTVRGGGPEILLVDIADRVEAIQAVIKSRQIPTDEVIRTKPLPRSFLDYHFAGIGVIKPWVGTSDGWF